MRCRAVRCTCDERVMQLLKWIVARRHPAARPAARRLRGGTLFWKYVVLFTVVTSAALVINGLVDIWFTFRDHRAALFRIQKEQAISAASKITQFIREIEGQLGWTTHLSWETAAIEQRAARRPQAAAPGAGHRGAGPARRPGARAAAHLAAGHGRVGSNVDFSAGGQVQGGARQQGLLRAGLFPARHRAVHDARHGRRAPRRRRQRRRGQPHAHLGRGQPDPGRPGRPGLRRRRARPADRPSRDQPGAAQYGLLAACAGQVGAARPRDAPTSRRRRSRTTIDGERVLAAHAMAAPLNWLVLVELPEHEANAPLYTAIVRIVIVLLAGLAAGAARGAAAGAPDGGPVRALPPGAARIGAGALDHRITIKTGRRAGGAGRPAQRHGGQAAELLRHARAQGGGAHASSCRRPICRSRASWRRQATTCASRCTR